MNGTNRLIFSEELLRDALQHYFDTVVFMPGKSPLITDFRYVDEDAAYSADLSQREPEEI